MASTTSVSAEAAALLRAMPVSRLLDGGMSRADAAELAAAAEAGAEWSEVAEQLGEAQRERAATASGHVREAALRAAAAAFNFAQMSFSQDGDQKVALYARFSATIAELAADSDGRIRRIEVPFGTGHLVGWLCLPYATSMRPPTVIQWGGLSGWGPTYLNSADALNGRGIACLLAEGPGQGSPRLNDEIYLGPDFVSGFGAFITTVLASADLGDVVGIQGNSFGGLFAAHLASYDARVRACVINGAPSKPILPEFRTPREQLLAALGSTADEAERLLPAFAFDAAKQSIGCPLLVLQGGADPLATPDQQAEFLAGGDPALTSQRIWPDGEHTLYNHADERDSEVAEWFSRAFGLPPRGESHVD